ncbi:uncharacterized protein LOC131947188 isoform X6 [Physella acuta]|uniref:uncharacterized protein LOC131947188 isoform X6 n=1 Tax=Physella acuta TaxID=109671 RepID=UPI0027DDA52A|nr:uncharacterized protein LOC131947188 isoform X6 [Physella acuta]
MDYFVRNLMASQEGKKRRSFLPSFKKSSGISPPSPQAPPSSSTPALLSNLSSVTSLTSSPIVQLPPVTGRAAPYSDREQHRSVTAPYSDREQHRTVTAPYSDREQHRPVTAPYSDREQHRPVTAPYSDREQHRPVTAPYSDREQHRPVTAPYSDREQHRPVTAPYSDREQHRPVTAPYSDREQHRPVTAPYSDREQHRPVTAPYSDREQHRPVQLPKKEKEENLSFGVGLRVGARVKIGGIKPGILRYLGTTHLAPGIFCGIELFDPDGNHDGEVNGHRYFTCAPNYGIFAPKEKVCLETASALGRLASDSEGCYSSSESLHERTSKAFKCYEEGELEAIDCTKLSPIISPQEVDDDVVTRQHRASKLPSKSKLASVYRGADLSPEPLEPPDLEDIPQKRAKSGLPRARSSLPAPPVSQSKLPTFSRSYAKYSEPPSLYARTITYSGQPYEQQIQESLKKSQNAPVLTDSDVDSERYKTGSARSSEDSEEDGFVRDTLSRGIKKQLRADSRQYLNFTFDPEEITQSQDADDSDDSDVETYRAANPPSTVNPLYVDPHFIRDISGESSDDGVHCQRASSQSVTLAEHSSYLPSEELPTVTSAVYSSRVPGAIRSDSYTIGVANERRVISMSFSGSESDDDATRLSATRSISESDLPPEMLPRVDDGSLGGFPADSDTGDDDRISEGYVPDTDSELGTLTTNSPNTDWVDRRGVTHPTSHAPTERGLQQMDIDMDDKLSTPSLTETTPTCSGHSLGTAKNTEDEDYNSDLQTNTEDDRIEADQLYGHDGTGSLTPELPPPTDMDDHAHSSGADDTHDVCGDSAAGSSPAPNRGSSPREEDDGKSSKKDDAAQQRTGRQKKPITITKKRSENVDHKMPNINVTSKLADYIKAPTPVKPREEREPKKVFNKNAKNLMQKRGNENKTKAEISRASSVDSVDREKVDKPEKPEKPKPIIKREKPKSKWDNIMSQIEQSKDTTKPKPKSDIKSSLAAYLSTPPPQLPTDNNAVVGVVKNDQQPPKKREFVKRIKPLPPPPPKIDLSKIKSKLNVPTAASAVKAMPKRDVSPGHGKVKNRVSRDNSPGGSSAMLQDGLKKRMSDGHIVLLRQELSTTVSSVRTSRTDLSGCVSMESVADSKGNTSKRGSVDVAMKVDRRFSTNSIKSDFSDRTKPDHAQLNQEGRSRRSQVKSTIPPHTPVKLPSRAMEIRLGDASSISSQRSSPTPVIIKPIKPKPKSNANAKNSPSKPAWGATKPAPPPVSALNKGRDSSANRKNKLNGAIKSTPAASAPKASTTAASAAQKEIERLESLCEARTKELTHTRIQLKATSQGFDAMAVLVNYCCAELNAFECPELAKKLETVQRQLADCLAQISELSKEKDTLGQHLSEVIQEKDEAVKKIEEAMCSAQTEREEHAKVTRDMDDTHNAALTAQRDELTSKHEEAMKKFRLFYEKQMEFMKQGHERQISEVKNEGKLEMNGIRISHLEEIQELRNKHDCQMEELHKQHRNKLEDITCRFESIKLNLSEKVESLRGECEDLRHRARNSEEALQRDADVKVQMALAPFLSLPKEIESLKTVVEMRNEEIQKLRTKNMDLEKQLEEVPIGREKILSLQQKVENLEAIINIKTDHEKQLHERCQVLMRKFDRATRANKRLSMDYEQVMWRMSQSSDFGSSESLTQRQLSRSPPRSPDGRRRTLSPNSAGEVVMRKKRNSHSVGDGERKLRSRSATFVVEKTESSDSHSPSSSPQPKLKRWRKKSEAEEGKDGKSRVERMCHSAGAELISHLEGQDEAPGSTDPSDSMTSSVEMAESLARSVSGVSDSGVYDSMTRSDMLNSSVVSTDSEWAASVNLSMTYDSNIDDLDPDLKSGDFSSLNEVTVLHGSRSVTRSKSGMKASNTVLFCPEKSCEDTKTGPARVEEAVGRPENGDEVFDESVSMESSCCSFDNLDLDNGSRLVSEDFPPDDPPPGTPGKVSEVVVPLDKGDKSVLVPLDKGDKSALKSSQAE